MLKIDIHGMNDGEYEIDISTNISEIECYFREFYGVVKLQGKIRKISNRFTVVAQSTVMAELECDRSLQKYSEAITANIKLVYLSNTKAYLENQNNEDLNENEIYIREDAQHIDVTKDVMELLALNLPMKRVAPEYRDKEITDIYPELKEKESVIEDDRWSKLKNFKIN